MEIYENLQNVEDYVPLTSWDALYHDEHHWPRTPATTLFFSVPNLEFLVSEIARETGRLLNRQVIVVPNNAMFSYVEDLVFRLRNFADFGQVVDDLNKEIYKHEVMEQYRGLRRRELFFKLMFFKDRQRVIEPPISEQGRKRQIRPSSVDYALNNPNARWFADFQNKQKYALDS